MFLSLALLILFYFTFPLLIIYMCKRWSVLKKVGSIVLAYAFGLLLGSSGILPVGSEGYRFALQGRTSMKPVELEALVKDGKAVERDYYVNHIAEVQDIIPAIVIPLAFPLLLFSLNIRKWLKYAKRGYLSVGLALVSGLIMVPVGFFIFKNQIPDDWKMAGMFVGIYSGGTPNLVALKLALNVDPSLFVIVSTYDVIVGAFLVMFYITLAPKLFRLILPPFRNTENGSGEVHGKVIKEIATDYEDYSGMFRKGRLLPLLKALGLSVVIVVVSLGISLVLPGIPQMVVVILSITTLSILASLVRSLNRIEKTFQLGMYLILVFSLTVASMADLRTMLNIGMLNLILFISWCYFGSLFLHIILAWIFRIDSDNFLITSAAFIFSPPFVPMVAGALKNKDIIITGITGGILGYILGNYFGIALAYFLKGL
jgi:uncharacterized membrane protein